MLFCDLHLFNLKQLQSPDEFFQKYSSNINYVFYLDEEISSLFIQHAAIKCASNKGRTRFVLWRNNSSSWKNYIASFVFVKRQQVDVVLFHGMVKPLWLIIAATIFGKKVKIMLQNHAEKPFDNYKNLFQKLADRFVSAYLFVSTQQALPWIESGIISSHKKIFEVMEGSTSFKVKNKKEAKKNLGYTDKTLFIWVGRLDTNKDPLTILKAFSEYAKQNQDTKLMMVYGTSDLEAEVKLFIEQNLLSSHIDLLGKLEHHLLEEHYNAADYFMLGSRYEGSGYALCEAMACGCIPIVTKIPSFESMTNNGDCGFLFEPGNANELLAILRQLNPREIEVLKSKVLLKFKNDLSFEAIANRISEVAQLLAQK